MSNTEHVPFFEHYSIAADARAGIATSPAEQIGNDRLFIVSQAVNPLDVESARAFCRGLRTFVEDNRYTRFQGEMSATALEAFYTDAAQSGQAAMQREVEDILDPTQEGVSFVLAHMTPLGLAVAWIGNCSAALIRDGRTAAQTESHTLHTELRSMDQDITSTTPNSVMRVVKPNTGQTPVLDMKLWGDVSETDVIMLGNRNLMEQDDVLATFQKITNHHETSTDIPLAGGIKLTGTVAAPIIATPVAASAAVASVETKKPAATAEKKPEKKSRNFWLWLLFGAMLLVLLYFLFFRPYASETMSPSDTFKARLQNELMGANTLNERIVAYRLALERADDDVDPSLVTQAENEYENLLSERKNEESKVIQLSEQLDGLQVQQQDVIRKINEVDSRYRDADRGRTLSNGDKRDRFIKTMEDLVPVRQDYAVDSMRIAREVTRTKEELYAARENLGLKVDDEMPEISRPTTPTPVEEVAPTQPKPEPTPAPEPSPTPKPQPAPEPTPEPAPTAQVKPDKKWAAREGIHVIIKDGKYGFMDASGKVLYTPQLQSAGSFSNGRARVKRNGKWGFMTKSMKLIVPYKYSDALNFGTICDGYAKVIKGGAIVFVDVNGREFSKQPCN